MKTNGPIRTALALCLQILIALPAFSPGAAGATAATGLSVFLIDDQTGEELAVKHGIQPLQTGDLGIILNAVLSEGKAVRLFHQAVDEDAKDNPTATLDFRPYTGGPSPAAPSAGLPVQQFGKAVTKWRQERAVWQQGILRYRKHMIGQVEGFVRQVAVTQMEVAQRFDRMLLANKGRDFNRSDIVGCIIAANQALAGKNRKVIILNTDADDLPAGRAPRRSGLTAAELDPSIELIFVNTSYLPEKMPMFTGIKNVVHHADTMQEAMEMVVSMLASLEGEGGEPTEE